MRYSSRLRRMAIPFAAITFIFFVGCQKSSGGGMDDDLGGGSFDLNDNYDPGFQSDVNIGSGLTDADKQALGNVDKEMQQVAPQSDWQIPADMQAKINELLKEEKECAQGDSQSCIDAQQIKMQLAQQILTKCMATVIPLVPKPGQPLMGSWAGGCGVSFDVSGTGDNGAYTVGNGGDGASQQNTNTTTAPKAIRAADKKKDDTPAPATVNGTMQAAADGSGSVKSSTFNGKLTDQPSSGQGSLTNPQYKKTKYGYDPCTANVSLKDSTNPIPRNYEEGMKRAGSCHRKALMLMSPIFDNLFKSLSPEAAKMLQMQSLGIKQ